MQKFHRIPWGKGQEEFLEKHAFSLIVNSDIDFLLFLSLTSWSTASFPTRASPTNSTRSGMLTAISLARAVIKGALSCIRPAVSTSTTSKAWLRAGGKRHRRYTCDFTIWVILIINIFTSSTPLLLQLRYSTCKNQEGTTALHPPGKQSLYSLQIQPVMYYSTYHRRWLPWQFQQHPSRSPSHRAGLLAVLRASLEDAESSGGADEYGAAPLPRHEMCHRLRSAQWNHSLWARKRSGPRQRQSLSVYFCNLKQGLGKYSILLT